MKSLAALTCLLVITQAFPHEDLFKQEWFMFKAKHNKNYENIKEELNRMQIYQQNKLKIERHNQLYENGLVQFKLQMNHFGDLLPHEFTALVNGFNKSSSSSRISGATFIRPAHFKVPNNVDWRQQGAVTPIKNQEQCGSCWAFSSTGSLEGQHFRKTGQLVSLSEQNLVDCSRSYGNNGCDGGLMDFAFEYIKNNKGIDTEKSYPYEAVDDRCRYNAKNSGANDVGYVDIPSGDEQALLEAVATVGPISVAIDASRQSFQFYSEGVYDERSCSSTALDHGVLAVGYGTDEDGKDYWLVKNSWGESWGEEGYIKMSRNQHNQCGIATQASYPLV